MKEQRQSLIDNSIETELADVEGANSRFVDLGFIQPAISEVPDYAGKFISAVQNASDIVSGSENAKTNNALAKAKATTDARVHHEAYLDELAAHEMRNGFMDANTKNGKIVSAFDTSVLSFSGKPQAYIDTYITQRGYFTNTAISANSTKQRSIVDANNDDVATDGMNAGLHSNNPNDESLDTSSASYRQATKNTLTHQQQSAKILSMGSQRVDSLSKTYAYDFDKWTLNYQTVTQQVIVDKGGLNFKLNKKQSQRVDHMLELAMSDVINNYGESAWTSQTEKAHRVRFEAETRGNAIKDEVDKTVSTQGLAPAANAQRLISELKAIQKHDKSGFIIDLNTQEAFNLQTSIKGLQDVVIYTESSQRFDPTKVSLASFKKQLQSRLSGTLPTHISSYLDNKQSELFNATLTSVIDGTAMNSPVSLTAINNMLALNANQTGFDKPVATMVNDLIQKWRDPDSGVEVGSYMKFLRSTLRGEEAKNSYLWQTMEENPVFAALTAIDDFGVLSEQYSKELLGLGPDDFTEDGSIRLPGQNPESNLSKARMVIAGDILKDAVVAPSQIKDSMNMILWLLTRPGLDEDKVRKHYIDNNKVDLGTPLPGFKKDDFTIPRMFKEIIQQDASFKDMNGNRANGITSTAILASIEGQYRNELNKMGMGAYTEVYNVGLKGNYRKRLKRTRFDWSTVETSWHTPRAGVYMLRIARSDDSYIEVPVDPKLVVAKLDEARDRAKIAFRSGAIQEAYNVTGLTTRDAEHYYKNPGADKPWTLLGNDFIASVFESSSKADETLENMEVGNYKFKE